MREPLLKALAEFPDRLTIGGKVYDIPPITLSKLDLLSDLLEKFETIREESATGKSGMASLKSTLGDAARAFLILKQENTEDGVKVPSEEEIQKAKNIVFVKDVPLIIAVMFLSLKFEDLLKNVDKPQEQISPGASSSPASSVLPDGNLTTLPAESQLEV
jgi:hypothetical protein